MSRGGRNTKIHTLVDGLGNPISFMLSPGNEHDFIVEFTASDVAILPYNPTLVSNGETYDCGSSYYFDAETGAFTHGQLVFVGITVEELAANATLKTERVFNQYVPATYDLAQ